MELVITDEYKAAYNIIEVEGISAFLSGKAGTGKSTFLKFLTDHSTKNYILLAPTGLAALNIGGATIHSTFKINPGNPDPNAFRLLDDERIDMLKAIDLLIIDEISMVRADIMDCIDRGLRNARGTNRPFGGVQVVFFGDVFQLPPVVTKSEREYISARYASPYFFHSNVLAQCDLDYLEFTVVFRQKDPRFLEILDAIRIGDIFEEDLAELNTRVVDPDENINEDIVTITTTNESARLINERSLEKLPGAGVCFNAHISGRIQTNELPVPQSLILKVGALVSFAKNDPAKRWGNGTTGIITAIDYNRVLVRLTDGSEYFVEPVTWDTIEYKYDRESKTIHSEILGSYTQIPLRLAWAITIHKSQGMTFPQVKIDFGNGTFEHGQAYVALSRCKSLEGIFLTRPVTERDFRHDPTVSRYFEQMQ